MKLNLREAGRLRRDIERWLVENDPDPERNVSIHMENVADRLGEMRESVKERVKDHLAVLGALFEVRRVIGSANAESGIDDLLTRQAHLQTRLGRIQQLVVDKDRLPGHDVIVKEVEAEREKDARAEGRTPYLRRPIGGDRYNVLLPEDMDEMERLSTEARRALRAVQDDILRTNMETTVELENTTADLLREHGLL